jgi:putative ATP-binding cassette transporter
LSSGEQQRLAFCRLFVRDYDLVLLDEATSNISNEAEKSIYKLLQGRKLTYISINHNYSIRDYHQSVIELKSLD